MRAVRGVGVGKRVRSHAKVPALLTVRTRCPTIDGMVLIGANKEDLQYVRRRVKPPLLKHSTTPRDPVAFCSSRRYLYALFLRQPNPGRLHVTSDSPHRVSTISMMSFGARSTRSAVDLCPNENHYSTLIPRERHRSLSGSCMMWVVVGANVKRQSAWCVRVCVSVRAYVMGRGYRGFTIVSDHCAYVLMSIRTPIAPIPAVTFFSSCLGL